MFRVIVTVLGLELLSACVGNRPYRLGGIADEFYPNQKPPFEQSTVSADQNYRLSFVEFDERGDFWDRRQLGEASRAIRESEKPTLLVIFIHGWHHNADDRSRAAKIRATWKRFVVCFPNLRSLKACADFKSTASSSDGGGGL